MMKKKSNKQAFKIPAKKKRKPVAKKKNRVNYKTVGIIAAGVLAPVGFYFRKRICRAFSQIRHDTMQMLPKKLSDEELAHYEFIHSPDGRFQLAISKEKSVNGQLVGFEVLLLEERHVHFTHLHTQPEIAEVSNNGITALFDRKNAEHASELLIYDKQGKTLFKKASQMLPHELALHHEGKVAVFVEKKGQSAKTVAVTVYLPEIDVKHEFLLDFIPVELQLDKEGKHITIQDQAGLTRYYSFLGQWINQETYENELLNKGDREIVMDYFLDRMEKNPGHYMQWNAFVQFLDNLRDIEPESGKLSRVAAFLYRLAGEYHEDEGNTDKAIAYYQQALDKYERVGVKTKLKGLQEGE